MIESAKYVEGTVKELVSLGLKVNGFELDAASLGCLLAMGIGECVGIQEKPEGKKGRAPKIYRIVMEQTVVFSTEYVEQAEEKLIE